MKPDWDSLGSEYADSKKVVIGDVDCTSITLPKKCTHILIFTTTNTIIFGSCLSFYFGQRAIAACSGRER